jgi:hypothetical protein
MILLFFQTRYIDPSLGLLAHILGLIAHMIAHLHANLWAYSASEPVNFKIGEFTTDIMLDEHIVYKVPLLLPSQRLRYA